MIINWITRSKAWAFRHIANHCSKAMPEHKHTFDEESGDVNYVCSPSFLKKDVDQSKNILHLDGNRFYERFIK